MIDPGQAALGGKVAQEKSCRHMLSGDRTQDKTAAEQNALDTPLLFAL